MWFSTLGCVNFQSKSTKKRPHCGLLYQQQCQQHQQLPGSQQQQQPQALLAGAGPWERSLYIVYIVVYIYLSVYGKQQKKQQQRHSNLYGERPRRLRIFARSNSKRKSNSCSGAQAEWGTDICEWCTVRAAASADGSP